MRTLLIAAMVFVSAAAYAAGTPKERAACHGDVQRFCKAVMNGTIFEIGACLKQNRAKLSPKCRTVLAAHGM